MEHPENDCKYKGLQVNSGVNSAPTINPYRRARARVQLSVNDIITNTPYKEEQSYEEETR